MSIAAEDAYPPMTTRKIAVSCCRLQLQRKLWFYIQILLKVKGAQDSRNSPGMGMGMGNGEHVVLIP